MNRPVQIVTAAIPVFVLFAKAMGAGTYTPVDLFTLNPPAGFTNPSISTLNAISPLQVVGFASDVNRSNQAIYWNSSGVATNLQPSTSYVQTIANGVFGSKEVGYGSGPITGINRNASSGYNIHALTWSGTGASAVDIHPTNLPAIVQSAATGANANFVVGYGMLADNVDHALLWTNGNTATDLQPAQSGAYASFYASIAYAVDGSREVGRVFNSSFNHAVIWSGTAGSIIDLHPTQLPFIAGNSSTALGISGNQEVGFGTGYVGGNPVNHALMWMGTAASAVDLDPGGIYISSSALATNGAQQVGFGVTAGSPSALMHAMLWSGTAASAVDLHSLLGTGFHDSEAFTINSAGDVTGTARDTVGNLHEILWVAPPHSVTTFIPSGTNSSATLVGRSSIGGGVHVIFSSSAGGNFTNLSSLQTVQALTAATAPATFAAPAGNLVQTWDLTYAGVITGPVTLTFQYDDSMFPVGFNEADLRIEHFEGGQWVTLAGTVNASQNTITVTANSLSPFALAAVPEPSSVGMLCVGALLLLRRRKDRQSCC